MEIGEEAAVVGLHFDLSKDDFVFGTHRNHGEAIAKAFSAINKMDDAELTNIMETYHKGAILNVAKKLDT